MVTQVEGFPLPKSHNKVKTLCFHFHKTYEHKLGRVVTYAEKLSLLNHMSPLTMPSLDVELQNKNIRFALPQDLSNLENGDFY